MSLTEFINEVVLASVAEAVLLLFLFLAFTDQRGFLRNKKLSCLVAIVLHSIFSWWSYRVNDSFPSAMNTISILVFTVMLFSVITHINIYSSVIAVLLSAIIIGVTEFVVVGGEMILFGIGVDTLLGVPEYKLSSLFIIRVLQLLVAMYLLLKTRLAISVSVLNKKYTGAIFPLFQAGLLLLFLMVYVSLPADKVNSAVNIASFYVIIALLLVINVFEWREREATLKRQSRFEVQEQYVKNIETVIDMVRKEKHDFANHLNTLAGLCSLNREDALEKVREYLQSVTHGNHSSYTFYASGSDYVDGLLAVKSSVAHQRGIHLDVDFDMPLSEVDIDEGELISVISNIVDNAFDAFALDQKQEGKVLSILTYTQEDCLYLSISNNGPEIPGKYLDKVFNDKFSTKSQKKDRGYGLYIVQEIVRKNGGKVSVNSTYGHTEFLVELKRKKEIEEKTA